RRPHSHSSHSLLSLLLHRRVPLSNFFRRFTRSRRPRGARRPPFSRPLPFHNMNFSSWSVVHISFGFIPDCIVLNIAIEDLDFVARLSSPLLAKRRNRARSRQPPGVLLQVLRRKQR